MLTMLDIPLLSSRHVANKLVTLYKIINDYFYFPSNIFVPSPSSYSHRSYPSFLLPFCRTNYCLYSFVPHVITVWNSLPFCKNCYICSFLQKRYLYPFFLHLILLINIYFFIIINLSIYLFIFWPMLVLASIGYVMCLV